MTKFDFPPISDHTIRGINPSDCQALKQFEVACSSLDGKLNLFTPEEWDKLVNEEDLKNFPNKSYWTRVRGERDNPRLTRELKPEVKDRRRKEAEDRRGMEEEEEKTKSDLNTIPEHEETTTQTSEAAVAVAPV